MSTSSDSVLELVGKFAVTMTLVFAGLLMRGWVASTLWNWFIAAPFNAPVLGVWSAIGVGIVVSVFTADFTKIAKEAKDDEDGWAKSTTRTATVILAVYPLMLGMGWLIHSLA